MKNGLELNKKTYTILKKWAEGEIKQYKKFIKQLEKEYAKENKQKVS